MFVSQKNDEVTALKEQLAALTASDGIVAAMRANANVLTLNGNGANGKADVVTLLDPNEHIVPTAPPKHNGSLFRHKGLKDANGSAITPGEFFTDHQEYKTWFNHVAPNGNFHDKVKIDSPAIQIDGGWKTLISHVPVQTDWYGMVPIPPKVLTVQDIITVGTTSSDTVEYVRVVSETNAAAPVKEAAGTADNAAIKPESAMTLQKVSTPVKNIAHWIPATKKALSDSGQLRTLIDNFLTSGLEEELEDQIIAGDGTGENFVGISNTSGITLQAWDTDLLVTTRKARTQVRLAGRATPTAYLLNPLDWEAIDLMKDTTGRYYYDGPRGTGPQELWSLPVVESEGVPQGTGFVGDFRQCVLWDREQASIQATNSHADFFVRNLVAILAELRAAFGVLRPPAIVKMDLTAL